MPAFLYCCLRWYQSVQSLLNVKSPNQPAQPGIRPRLSASAPLSTPPGTRPWLSLAERGPSTVTGTSSSSLSSLTSLASVSTGCKGVSSKCFGENYIYIVCQSVKYYLCQNQIQNIKKNLHSIFRRIVKTLQPETIQNIEEKLSRSALKLLWSKKAKKTK